MADARERHLRRLRRALGSARRWTVVGAVLSGATAVLVPYAGVGLPDAFWAAAAGGSVVMAVFRWRDHRQLTRLPIPPPEERPELSGRGQLAHGALRAVVAANPVVKAAVDDVGRRAGRRRFRGSAAAPAWDRLDAASATLREIRGPVGEQVGEALREAAAGERSLRDLAGRVATTERALRFAKADTRGRLTEVRQVLLTRLDDGVGTYERLAAAAASCAAEHGVAADPIAATRLTDAADRMAAFAQALSELRDVRVT